MNKRSINIHQFRDLKVSAMNRLVAITYKTYLLLFICLLSNGHRQADAQLWSNHASEAEAYEIISELLQAAELPPSKIRRGSYPLYRKGLDTQYFPLVSAPCPLLSDCETLIKSLRARILRHGYHLVYSEQESRPSGPLHYAVARGQTPVLAIRLLPAASSATLLYHISSQSTISQSDLGGLNPFLSFVIDESMTKVFDLIMWLDQSRREYVIKLDALTIKQALLHPSTGEVLTDFKDRKAAFSEYLRNLIKYAPNSIGFYVNQEVNLSLDRAAIDELIAFCAQHNRLLVTANLSDNLVQSIARAHGVRAFEFVHRLVNKKFDENLKGLETQLVINGEVSAEFDMTGPQKRNILASWMHELTQREVVLLSISESAW